MILKVIAGTSPKRKKTIFNKLVFFDLSRNAKRKQMKKNWAQISALTTRQIPKNKPYIKKWDFFMRMIKLAAQIEETENKEAIIWALPTSYKRK